LVGNCCFGGVVVAVLGVLPPPVVPLCSLMLGTTLLPGVVAAVPGVTLVPGVPGVTLPPGVVVGAVVVAAPGVTLPPGVVAALLGLEIVCPCGEMAATGLPGCAAITPGPLNCAGCVVAATVGWP